MDASFIEVFRLHAFLSLVPGTLGAVLGVAIGSLLLRLLPPPGGVGRSINPIGLLVPWRGIVILALVLLLPSAYAPMLFGLGIPPALMTVFLATSVLALGLVFQNGVRVESGEATGPAASLRTALVASVGFAVVTFEFGSGSAGHLIRQGMQLFEHDVMWSGYAIVGILAILVDVAAGVGQLFLVRRAKTGMAAS